jgi:all-trans-8'-apo-beta-carotenal 15,15'-oxygenase
METLTAERSAPRPLSFASSPSPFETAAERAYRVDQISGRLPAELTGTLYRNGPGKLEIGGRPHDHLFDGDGMLSQFTLDGRGVSFRSRFVKTSHYLAEHNALKPKMRGIGKQRPGGPLANAFRRPGNVAQTSVSFQGGNLLALWEIGRPYRLDPDTLETFGEHDFDGALKRGRCFSAHPKWDPATGEMFNFGLDYGLRTKLRCYRVDPRGNMHYLQAVTLPYPVLNHDFALTDRHMVFVVDPIIIRLGRVMLGFTTFDDGVIFDDTKPTSVILVPREGGKPRIIETEPFFHYHINNAFEEGGDTVIDLVRYDNYEGVRKSLRNFWTETDPTFGYLWRMRVTPSDRLEMNQVCDWEGEYPQHDWRRTTRPYRYGYLLGKGEGGYLDTSVVKLDYQSGEAKSHDFGEGNFAGEPIFVPQHPEAAEDDGWLLTLVYSAAEHRSRLVVLDARDVEQDPIAEAHLHQHIPPGGFHGTFTPRIAA